MNSRAQNTLDDLARARWFVNVGQRDTDNAIVLSSWEEAIAHCESVDWDNLCLEAANQYRRRLLERNLDRYRMWNDVVNELRPVVVELVHKKIDDVVIEHKLPKSVFNRVRWDVLHVCMEAEYADVFQPGFYASRAYWYVVGHFPCGWRGEFPQGTVIIY